MGATLRALGWVVAASPRVVAGVVAPSLWEGKLSTVDRRERAGLGPDGAAPWPAAVLWDMDGTLVDTEPYWMEVEYEIAERHGGSWSDAHALNLVGNDLLGSGRYMREHMGIEPAPERIVEELLDGVVARVAGSVPWRPGAREQLAALRAAGVPCALVTMSYERFAAPILRALPPGTFDVIVTGDQVELGKPHPEPYLTAAAALGVEPEDCLAVEDSNTGATSAESAGCTVLVIPNHVPVLEGERRIFRDSLLGLDLASVRDAPAGWS